MHMAWVRQVCGRLKSDYRYSVKLVYNNFPWPRLEVGGRTDKAWPLSVRETHINFLMTPYDAGIPQETLPPKVVSKSGLGRDAKKVAAVEAKAQAVLDARARYPLSTLADLYDPLTMPADLVKAHADLDRAVDRCYRPQPFTSERQRVEFLFALYESYTAPLLPAEKTKRRRGRGKAKRSAKTRA